MIWMNCICVIYFHARYLKLHCFKNQSWNVYSSSFYCLFSQHSVDNVTFQSADHANICNTSVVNWELYLPLLLILGFIFICTSFEVVINIVRQLHLGKGSWFHLGLHPSFFNFLQKISHSYFEGYGPDRLGSQGGRRQWHEHFPASGASPPPVDRTFPACFSPKS